MRLHGSRLGDATLSNSSQSTGRKWFTIIQSEIAAGTRILDITQGQALLSSIDYYSIGVNPSVAVPKATASMNCVASAAAIPVATGTIRFREQTKTVNRVVRVTVILIGIPDRLRAGS